MFPGELQDGDSYRDPLGSGRMFETRDFMFSVSCNLRARVRRKQSGRAFRPAPNCRPDRLSDSDLPLYSGSFAPSGTNQISTRRLPAASVPTGLVLPAVRTVTRARSTLRSLTRYVF